MAIRPELTFGGREPLTANEMLLDSFIRHQIFLQRAAGSIADDATEILNRSEPEVSEALLAAFALTSGGRERELAVAAALRRVIAVRAAAFDLAERLVLERLAAFIEREPEIMAGFVRAASPTRLDLAIPPPLPLIAGLALLAFPVPPRGPSAGRVPVRPRSAAEWMRNAAASDAGRISAAVTLASARGDSAVSVVRAVVGTRSAGGRDGLTERGRRDVDAVVDSAVNGASHAAEAALQGANAELFEKDLWVSVLDGNTTPVCRSLDGTRFSFGEGPYPPVHLRCRSRRVPVLDAEATANNPLKPAARDLIFGEFVAREGLGSVGPGDLTPGQREELGRFESRRVREIVGTAGAPVTYAQWLRRQGVAFQDDVLGPARAALFRRGGLALGQFTRRNGDEIPLRELKNRHRAAFEAAGLDTSDF